MIRVRALDTGRVMVHRRQVEPHPRDALRLPATLFDRRWTEWLAVWSFAIEHPDGVVVVDAGTDPDLRTPAWDLYQRIAVRFDTNEDDRIENRLRQAGLDPAGVLRHVFTHLHVDHVGAGPLPGVTAVVSSDEWAAAERPGSRLFGLMRPGFGDPETVEDDHDLLGDGSVRLIATPGHTAGHQSVLVTPEEGPRVLLAGDAVYSEAALVNSTIDGVGLYPEKARASIDRMRDLCREAPTIVAPTHDPGAAERLTAGRATRVD